MVSLETHNPANVPMYEHFGFKIFGIVQKNFDLKQYHDPGIQVEDKCGITFDYTVNSKIVYLQVQKFEQNG